MKKTSAKILDLNSWASLKILESANHWGACLNLCWCIFGEFAVVPHLPSFSVICHVGKKFRLVHLQEEAIFP